MFESILINVLNEHLGPYFFGFDASQLGVGVWEGKVHFENLRLKPNVIEEMGLAIEIKHGVIGTLDLEIPWKKLFPTPSAPVKAAIDQIFLVLAARPYTSKDIDKQNEREKEAKKKRVQALSEPPSKPLTEPKDLSFTEKLATSIINNIQITVGKVHIRYEDAVTIPGRPFAAGITLYDLSVQSVDATGKPAYLAGVPDVVDKKLSLGAFSVYLNQGDKPVGGLSLPDCVAQMHALTPHMRSPPGLHTYIIAPMALNVLVQINAANKPELPKFSANCNVSSITIALNESQYNYILFFADRATRESMQRKHLKYKVAYSKDGVLKTPRQRWGFAIDCFVEEQRRLHSLWSWRHFAGRRSDRLDYVNAYVEFLKAKGKPTSTLVQHLEEMEEKLSYEDIQAYRKMAESRVPPEPKSAKGFFGSLFSKLGGGKADATPLPAELSASERAAIYSAINYKEDETVKELVPSTLVVMVVNVEIEMIRINLNRDPTPGTLPAAPTAAIALVTQGVEAPVALASIVLSRLSAVYRQLSKDGAMTLDASMAELAALENISGKDQYILCKEPSEGDKPFVQFHLGLAPGSKDKADTTVRLTTTAFSVFVRYWVLPPILAFVKQPPNLCLSPMTDLTAQTVSGLQGQSKAGIIHAIATHKTVDLHVVLGEPSIHVLLPDSSDHLDVRLGSLQAKSHLVPKSQRNILEPTVSEMDAAYDRYSVTLSGLQVSFTKAELTRSLLEPMDINCTALQCVRDDIRGFPQYRIAVQIARIHFDFSPEAAAFATTLGDSITAGLKELSAGDANAGNTSKGKTKRPVVKSPEKDKKSKKSKAHWTQTTRRIRMLEAMHPDSTSTSTTDPDGKDPSLAKSGSAAVVQASRKMLTLARLSRQQPTKAKDDEDGDEFYSADEEGSPDPDSNSRAVDVEGVGAEGKGADKGEKGKEKKEASESEEEEEGGEFEDVVEPKADTLANPLDFMTLSATIDIEHIGVTLLERDVPVFETAIEMLRLPKCYLGDQYVIAEMSLKSFYFGPCNRPDEKILQSIALDNGQLLSIAAKYAEGQEMMKHPLFENTNAAIVFAVGTLRLSLHLETLQALLNHIDTLLKALAHAKANPAPAPLAADVPIVPAHAPAGQLALPPASAAPRRDSRAGRDPVAAAPSGASESTPSAGPSAASKAMAAATADPLATNEPVFAFKVNLQFGGIEATLGFQARTFIGVAIKGLAITAARDPFNSIAATVQLSSIEAVDTLRNLPLLTAVDERVLDLAILKPAVGDGAVRLHFSRLQCLVVLPAIMNAANFAAQLTQCELLKAKPVDPAAAAAAPPPPSPSPPPSDEEGDAAGAASFSAKDINSTMFWSLDIAIGTPIFIVPTNPDQPDAKSAFEAQLGSLTISNSRQAYSDPSCTLDEIVVRLDQVQITAKEGDTTSRHLLQPSCIEVALFRKLGQAASVPDMRLEARLEEVVVRVCDSDLAMVQQTLTGNMQGALFVPAVVVDETKEIAPEPLPQPPPRPVSQQEDGDDASGVSAIPIGIAAHALFGLLKVTLFNKEAPIAEFVMAGLDASFFNAPGEQMRCRVALDDISLCDVRVLERKNQFPYLFSKDQKALLDIIQKKTQRATASARASTRTSPEEDPAHTTKTAALATVVAAEAAAAGNPNSDAVITTDKPAAARAAAGRKLSAYGSGSLARLVQGRRVRHTEEQDPSLFELDVASDSTQQMIVHANVAPIRVTFCADFALALMAMFATFTASKPKTEDEVETEKEYESRKERSERARRLAEEKQRIMEANAAPALHKGSLVIRASIQGIKATVYAEPTDINSYGIRVGFAGDLSYGKNESQENVSLLLHDLRISSRRPLEHTYHLSDVLSRCSVQVTITKRGLTSVPRESSQINVDKMMIRVGYYDLVCVKEVISSISTKFQNDVAIKKRELHFGQVPVKHRWYTDDTTAVRVTRVRPQVSAGPGAIEGGQGEENSVPSSNLEMHLEQLDVLVVDDSGVADKRLISLTTTLDVDLAGISLLGVPLSGDLRAGVSLYLAAACFNENVTAWEPIIDPITDTGNTDDPTRRKNMWGINVTFEKTTQETDATEISVDCNKPLQLTITHHFLSSTLNSAFFRLLGKAPTNKRTPSTSELPPLVPMPDETRGTTLPTATSLAEAPPAIAAAAVVAATAPAPALAPASTPVSLGQNAHAVAFASEATTHNSVPVAPSNATFAALAAASTTSGTLASAALAAMPTTSGTGPTSPVTPHHTQQQTHVPYLTVKNCSGVSCVVATRVAGMAAVEVADGATVQISFAQDQYFTVEKPIDDVAERRSISLQFQGTTSPMTLYTEFVGKYAFPVLTNFVENLLVADITTSESGRLITLRSSYVLRNETDQAIDVFMRHPPGNTFDMLTTLEPNHFYCLPLSFIRNAELKVRPTALPCLESRDIIDLRSPYQLLACPSEVDPVKGQPYGLIANIAEEVYENFDDRRVINSPHHVVTISSPITLRNDLPVPMLFRQMITRDAQFTLAPGELIHLRDADVHLACAVPQLVQGASPLIPFSAKDPKRTTSFRITDQANTLQIAVHYANEHRPGQPLALSFYSPYWLVNRTGRDITYRESIDGRTGVSFQQSGDSLTPLLFAFPMSEHREHISFKLEGTEWGQPVNVSVVGHNDAVALTRPSACDWTVTVTSYLAGNGLTKVLIFQPYFVLVNQCEAPVTVAESATGGPAVTIAPGKAEPYWPLVHTNFVCRHADDVCAPHLLRLDTPSTFSLPYRHPAAPDVVIDVMDVSIRAQDGNTLAIFSDNPGRCDVRIENRSNATLLFRQPSKQPDHAPLHELPAHTTLYYFRDEPQGPMGLEIKLEGQGWKALSYEEFVYSPLVADRVWYLCFPDGNERVLVIVDRHDIAGTIAKASGVEAGEGVTLPVGETPTFGLSLQLNSIYLSIVSAEPREIVLLSITPRRVWQCELPDRNVWGERWERLEADMAAKINKAVREKKPVVSLRKDLEVNLSTMELTFGGKGQRRTARLRERVAPGAALTLFDNGVNALTRLTVEFLQIDNMMPGALTPVILTSSNRDRDFDEAMPLLRVLMHKSTSSVEGEKATTMFHRIAVALHPLVFMADDKFVTAMLEMAPVQHRDSTASTLAGDLQYVVDFTVNPDIQPKTDYMYLKKLQISDINADFSFFIVGQDTKEHPSPVTNILKSVGLVVTNIDGVPFRLTSLSLPNIFCASSELVSLLVSHYWTQFVREGLKVFGCLDIIGNPVKNFGHLGTGISNLTRNDDVLEGMLSLASNTVAGASGAVAGITGSIGNSIAVLSFDDEYRRKRIEDKLMHRSSSDQMLQGGKRMFEGFADGLTGVVSQPLEGAKKGGAAGFFKGVGKGLLGVVVKPVAGILDMTASTAGAVQAAAADGEQKRDRRRAPRFIRPDKIVPPYYESESLACDMLQNSGLLLPREVMWTHYYFKQAQQIIFLTSRALVMTSYVDGKLRMMWRAAWSTIAEVTVQPRGLEIVVRGSDGKGQPTLIPMNSVSSGQLALAASRLMRV
eukprot:m.77774 g.77774  ORF g.77774 m.77774 type:complete len:3510 (-) comp13223_c1_seq4:21-10550(-)